MPSNHKVVSFSWGSPEEISSKSTLLLQQEEKEGYELVSTAVLSGYCVLFLKREYEIISLDKDKQEEHELELSSIGGLG